MSKGGLRDAGGTGAILGVGPRRRRPAASRPAVECRPKAVADPPAAPGRIRGSDFPGGWRDHLSPGALEGRRTRGLKARKDRGSRAGARSYLRTHNSAPFSHPRPTAPRAVSAVCAADRTRSLLGAYSAPNSGPDFSPRIVARACRVFRCWLTRVGAGHARDSVCPHLGVARSGAWPPPTGTSRVRTRTRPANSGRCALAADPW